MPATNFTPIQLFHSSTSGTLPTTSQLFTGEIFWNIADNKVYGLNTAGTALQTIVGSLGNQDANTVAITGGSISGVSLTLDSLNSTPIGSTTPSTGAFTTLSTTGLATLNSLTTSNATVTGGSINTTPIGNTSPSTGAFTTLTASTSVLSPIVGAGTGSNLSLQANATTYATLDTSGNLGLAVTPTASDWTTLQIKRAILSGGLDDRTELSYNYVRYNNIDTYIGSDYALRYNQIGGQHQWLVAPSGTAGSPITFTQAMTLFNSGGLSLGNTTDPGAHNLSVSGYLTLGSAPSNTSGQVVRISEVFTAAYASGNSTTSSTILSNGVWTLFTQTQSSPNGASYGLYLIHRMGTSTAISTVINDGAITVTVNGSYQVVITNASGGSRTLQGNLSIQLGQAV